MESNMGTRLSLTLEDFKYYISFSVIQHHYTAIIIFLQNSFINQYFYNSMI